MSEKSIKSKSINEESLSRRRLIFRRFFRNKSAVFGLGILIFITALAIFG
ncbi:MAG: ABC transporter permease, partial [Actinobacteria bacterium]|nr:ABC transporter permease [Actinomycetota bacterium]